MAEVQKIRIGLYPGTFDPITYGHLQIIKRASKLVDKLVIAVADNDAKNPTFSAEERLAMVRGDIATMPDADKSCEIEVASFSNLLIHFAREKGASCMFRGLRAVSDFEYEFQMTGMNTRQDSEIETVFLMTGEKYQFISSSFIKEIFRLNGDVSEFVTPATLNALGKKFHTET